MAAAASMMPRSKKTHPPPPGAPPPAPVICHCDSQSPARKLDWVEPRQSRASALQFVSDDPAAWFRHDRIPALAELGQQRRLPSAGTSGDHDKSFADGVCGFSAAVGHLMYLCMPKRWADLAPINVLDRSI